MSIDYTNMSYHALADRGERFAFIEDTIGWGEPVATAQAERDNTVTETLTNTGVLIVRNEYNTIITAYVARCKQANRVWDNAKKGRMPRWLVNVINYNNNTEYWKRVSGLA